jgi:hypothetical protein
LHDTFSLFRRKTDWHIGFQYVINYSSNHLNYNKEYLKT